MAKPKLTSQLTSQLTSKKKSKASRTAADTAVPPAHSTPLAARVIRLPAAWIIARRALTTTWNHRWLFLGIAAIYMVSTIFLIRGFSDVSNLAQLKELLHDDVLSNINSFTRNVALLAFLVTATGDTSSDAAAAYQGFLLLITSLAIIWALRQVMTGTKVSIRDSFYKGMYPLIPVILVLLVVILALLPLILGTGLYSLMLESGVISTVLEQILWITVMLIGIGLSLYFLSSSLIALYIASLPDMTPIKAFRSARELVRGRRLPVIRKMLFLPFAIAVVATPIMLSVIALWTPAAPWVFYAVTMASLVLVHAYFYTLYRELLV